MHTPFFPHPNSKRRLSTTPNKEIAGLVAALFSLMLLLAVVQFHGLKASMLSDLEAAAELIAQNASHAIVIEDDTEAHELLSALARSKNLLKARLESPDGRLLAVYDNGQARRCDELMPLRVSRPVLAYGKQVGQLILTASSHKLLSWTAVFLGIGSISIAVAWFTSWLSARRAAKAARQAQQKLAWMSRHDPLTGCANREELRAHLRERFQSSPNHSALYLLDLDDFTVFNAAYGAHQGDAILRVIAQRLQTLVKPEDRLARLSADEFALSLQHGSEHSLLEFTTRIQEVLREPIFVGDVPLRATACIGVALLPDDANNEDSAIQSASAALSMARHAGHGSVCRYEEGHDRKLRDRADLTDALRLALVRGEFRLNYQPIYSMHGGRMNGAEALIRWKHPSRGLISPDRFVPIAESSGLIEEIGLHLLGLLQRDRQAWLCAGLQVPPIAINISSLQFPKEQSKDRFLQQLSALELGPDALEIELTERAAFEELEGKDSIIHRLKGRGYSISLDDFGTGYSSLSYLHRINCDKLKIDRSFVRRMDENPKAQQLVKAIVEVAHAFHMTTVAEGVETEGELNAVRNAGCTAVQGYLLDRPLDAHAFGERLAALNGKASEDAV
ncbi:putative bifunctional diguanylate cyclase/phosphodiesterase [Paucibacter sp. B51]|uniref:putative bifunctional diguanylate cyclase/phosphodiesterase n=1 Tax=Paucibacter sp. B51 TaxID=2993315 RepID=UPI0022EBD61D|nr:GGDEF and EAL domain-containing protein [Paucibacter sp. B51]